MITNVLSWRKQPAGKYSFFLNVTCFVSFFGGEGGVSWTDAAALRCSGPERGAPSLPSFRLLLPNQFSRQPFSAEALCRRSLCFRMKIFIDRNYVADGNSRYIVHEHKHCTPWGLNSLHLGHDFKIILHRIISAVYLPTSFCFRERISLCWRVGNQTYHSVTPRTRCISHVLEILPAAFKKFSRDNCPCTGLFFVRHNIEFLIFRRKRSSLCIG